MNGPSDADLKAIEIESLDDLMNDAIEDLVAARSRVPLKAAKRSAPPGQMRLDSTFKNPDNWTLVGVVKLVHQDTESGLITLCGDFLEHLHKGMRARKLERIEPDLTPIVGLPQKVEYVTDRWYIERISRPIPTPGRVLYFTVTLDRRLEGGLGAREGPLLVSAVRGEGIARAELGAEGARFATADGRTILYLPAGLDVLEGLTRECKIKIKEAFDVSSQSS
jgi:hypothetical protein